MVILELVCYRVADHVSLVVDFSVGVQITVGGVLRIVFPEINGYRSAFLRQFLAPEQIAVEALVVGDGGEGSLVPVDEAAVACQEVRQECAAGGPVIGASVGHELEGGGGVEFELVAAVGAMT